ncbi:MAG: T9SS type A sorting domain-containing protein [Cyclobacteriaceae bacterium]|jgi:hypothetical protein|nr:T9SS type A sorting domain-containing protein [Cyclobacteriaceae bacterium]
MKHMYILLLLWPAAVGAQTLSSRVVASGGGQLSSSTVHVSLTLGQPLAGDRSATGVLLHQGFQVSLIEAGPTAVAEFIALDVFPNPTTDKLTVGGIKNAPQYRFTWTDLQGRELTVPRSLAEDQVEFDVQALRAATYFLRIASAQGHYHLLKIVKTN